MLSVLVVVEVGGGQRRWAYFVFVWPPIPCTCKYVPIVVEFANGCVVVVVVHRKITEKETEKQGKKHNIFALIYGVNDVLV